MKKLFLTLIAGLLILSSCSKKEQFRVILNLDNANGQVVYLTKDLGMVEMCVDSAIFEGNTVVFKADFDDPQTKYIVKYDKNDMCRVFSFFSENRNITITGDYNDMEHWMAVGTHSLDEFNVYRQMSWPIEDAIMDRVHEMEMVCAEGDTVRCKELWAQAIAGMEEYQALLIDYVRNHPDDIMAHCLLDESKRDMDIEVLKDIVAGFTVETVYSNNIKNYIEQYERGEVVPSCIVVE